MNSFRIVLVVVLAACGLAAAVAWRWESTRIQSAASQLEELKAENAKLSTDLAAATEKMRALEAESAQLRAARAIAGTRLEPEAAAATPAQEEGRPKEQGGFLKKLFKDPYVRKVLAAQETAALREMYSDYLKQTSLTPDETDRFYQLLQERQMALMDSSASAMSGGEVDLKAATAAANATDDALRDLLGPARFAQYQQFEKSLGPRLEVQQFARQLAADGYPLEDSQRASLIRIFSQEAATAPAFENGAVSPAEIDRYSEEVAAADQRIYGRAETVLNPAQLGALAAFQKNMATSQLAGLKMTQQMLK
jgi:outer membrane murein-binding lipoprotein Lpp